MEVRGLSGLSSVPSLVIVRWISVTLVPRHAAVALSSHSARGGGIVIARDEFWRAELETSLGGDRVPQLAERADGALLAVHVR